MLKKFRNVKMNRPNSRRTCRLFRAECKKLLLLAALVLLGAALFPQEAADISVNFINDYRKASIIKGTNPQADVVLRDMEDLDPNYLAEIQYEIPADGHESIPETVASLFLDLSLYLEIPYYSKQSGVTVPLFSKAQLLSSRKTEDTAVNTVLFCMTPFSDYTADLTVQAGKNSFLFQHTNLDKMDYRGLAAIKRGAMRAGIAVYRDGSVWRIYALGGVKAAKPFFLKRRLETAFNNRIKDFCVFYIGKLAEMENS